MRPKRRLISFPRKCGELYRRASVLSNGSPAYETARDSESQLAFVVSHL
jgi:hypothetical protein